MPTYEFKNTETDEVFEKFMKYEDKEKYLEDNPHITTYYSKGPNIDYDGGGSILKKSKGGSLMKKSKGGSMMKKSKGGALNLNSKKK